MDIFPAVRVKDINGRLGLDVSDRYPEQFHEAMKRWAMKGFVQVILKAPESPATTEQNNFFHALLSVWWKSGLSSFANYEEMRNTIKARHGVSSEVEVGGERYLYLKSWSDYSKKSRTQCIDGLIAEMEQGGILSSDYATEYLEIINGVRNPS